MEGEQWAFTALHCSPSLLPCTAPLLPLHCSPALLPLHCSLPPFFTAPKWEGAAKGEQRR